MKKTYISPNTGIVNVETVRMIAASGGAWGGPHDDLDLNNTPTTTSTSGNLSRYTNRQVWGDDED